MGQTFSAIEQPLGQKCNPERREQKLTNLGLQEWVIAGGQDQETK
jgi:hypothetical protein